MPSANIETLPRAPPENKSRNPRISLLPAIARLLKIDMNELFSFREELTEKEIGIEIGQALEK